MARIVSKARQVRLAYQAKVGHSVSVQEVADAVGIDRKRLTQIELNRMERIDTETLTKLCQFYGVGVGDILEYVEDDAEKKSAPGPMIYAGALAP